MAEGTKVDEVFVDFAIRFEQANADAQRINQTMGEMGKVAGVAADAQRRFGTSTRQSFRESRRELAEAEREFDTRFRKVQQGADATATAFRRIAEDVRRANADLRAGALSSRDHAEALAFARREAIELRRGGLHPTGVELAAFNQVLTTTGTRTRSGARGLGTLRSGFTQLLISLTGIPGPLGRVASSLLLFGVGGFITAGVLGGLALLTLAWKKLTQGAREAREEMQRSREEAQRILAGQQPEVALRRTAEGTRRALAEADARVALERRGRLVATPGQAEFVVDVVELNKALSERNRIVRELAAVEQAAADQQAAAAKDRQGAIAAHVQGLLNLQQLQALEAADLARARDLHAEIVALLERETTIVGRAQLETLLRQLGGPTGLLAAGRTQQQLAAAMETARQLRATVVDINREIGLRGFDVSGRVTGSALAEFEGQLGGVRAARRGALGLGDSQGAFSAQEELRAQRALLQMDQERAAQVQALAEAEATLAAVLLEIRAIEEQIAATSDPTERIALTDQLRQAFTKLYGATTRVDGAMRGLGTSSRSAFLETAQGAALALRALNRLGDAAGFLDQDLRRAIDSALDLFQVIEQLQSAKSLSAGQALAMGGGLVAAGVGLVMGIGQALFGESERDRLLRDNTAQLARLASEAEALRSVFGRVTGRQLNDTGAAIARARRERNPFSPGQSFVRDALSPDDLRLIEETAEAFGITIDDSIASLDQLAQAIQEVDFARLTESFQGAMDMLQREFALFDIDDPIEQLERYRAALLEFANLPEGARAALAGFDLSTPEGRAQLDAMLRSMFRAIQMGALGPDVLGDMTLTEFLDLIGRLESTIDELDADADDGTAESFARSSRITEVQGAAIVSILDTMNLRAGQQVRLGEQSVSELERIRTILARAAPTPPPPPSDSTSGGGDVVTGPVTLQVAVHLPPGAATSPELAGAAIGEHAAAAFDEALRERAARQRRAGGA